MRIVRRSLSILVGCSLILGLTPTFAQQPTNQNQPTAINVVNPATPTEVALAMGIDPADLVSASFLGSDPVAFGVSNTQLGEHFPNYGSSFSIMSTGRAIDATLPDTPGFTLGYSQNETVHNEDGLDLAQLRLQLQVPADKNCALFDFAFYTEEYPDFVQARYNDAFTAESGGTDLSISTYTYHNNTPDLDDDYDVDYVVSPLNFAYDINQKPITVRSGFNFSPNTGTTYNGSSYVLRSNTPVDPGTVVTIVLSIQDLGDNGGDSAVFLDNFFWSSNASCGQGPAAVDSDGDGLLDSWEINGYNGVDLPAMGADPYHKDIFVEADYMIETDPHNRHSHKPLKESMALVVNAFAFAPVSNPDGVQGINLHIDSGPDSKMKADGTLWGSLSRANSITHDDQLGDIDNNFVYDWTEFNGHKNTFFEQARQPIFHYTIFAHNIDDTRLYSGIAAMTNYTMEGSHFIVSMGTRISNPDYIMMEAGTFMHELGHNLGLHHGGIDDSQYKPNYLSVMNYYFQMSGLITRQGSRKLDYSRFNTIPSLDENNLNEMNSISNDPAINKYRTFKRCFDSNINDWVSIIDNNANQLGWIDWNCNDIKDVAPYARNINKFDDLDTDLGWLHSFSDWDRLVYNGGAIGAPGSDRGEIVSSEVDEAPIDDLIHTDLPYMLSISGDSYKNVLPNTATVSHTFTITNAGQLADSYTISATSSLGWNVSYTPQTISLAPGQSTQITVFEDIVSNGLVSKTDNLTIIVRSTHDSYTAAEAHGYTKTMVTPKVAFFPDSYSTEEKNVTVLVKVVLDKPVTSMVSVNFNTTNGTATGLLPCTSPRCVGTDGDFVHTSGVITFQPGQVEQFIPIQIQGDLINDPNEVFYINLSSPQSAVLGTFATASIQIQ